MPSDLAGKSFSKNWWRQFINETHDLTNARTFKHCIRHSDVQLLRSGVVEALRTKYLQQNGAEDLRIYIGSELKSETYLEHLFECPPSISEGISTYTNRTFEEDFCIILNKGEKYSEILSRHVLEMIEPLFLNLGIPALGADITVFVGNYGWTPLGIHRDRPGENVFHFHLGPSPKTIYLWSDEMYQAISGGRQNNNNIEPILPHARVHTQYAGDMFFMPWDLFHVGRSDELSVTVTVWLNNSPREKYVKTLVSEYLRFNLSDERLLTPSDLVSLRHCDFAVNLSEMLGIDEDILNISLNDLILRSDAEHFLCLQSNGGWQSHPITLRESTLCGPATGGDLLEKTVKLVRPFRIFYEETGDRLNVFVRGRKLEIRHFPAIVTLIDRLNETREVQVRELLTEVNGEIPEKDLLFFISHLIDKRGLELTEP